MSKIKDQIIEDQMKIDDMDYGHPINSDPDRELELITMQIRLWGNVRDQKQEVVDLAEMQLEEVNSKLSNLRAKKLMLEAQIDSERMGHPKDE